MAIGFGSPALTAGRSASSTAPPNVVVVARAIHARRVICVSSMVERPLCDMKIMVKRCDSYPRKLVRFAYGVDSHHRCGAATAPVLLAGVQFGVRALQRITQRQHWIERAGANGRADAVRQVGLRLNRDRAGESGVDLSRGSVISVAQQRHELVATPARDNVGLTQDALEC